MQSLRTSFGRSRRYGSALIMSVICSAVITVGAAVTLEIIESRYRAVHQAAIWKESLLSAEAGIEMAMNEVRKELYDPSNAWAGWTQNSDATVFPIAYAPSSSPSATSHSITSNIMLREGEGGQRSWARVSVDAPPTLIDQTGEQWYRIRSLGIAELSGGGVIAGEREDATLRKFDLAFDRRTGQRVLFPRSSRLIEAIIKPVGAFRIGFWGIKSVDMTNHNVLIDSYDSRYESKSTNGAYDPAKRQSNGDVATDGQLINAGNAQIYGDVMTNGGDVQKTGNIHGEIRNDFYQEVFNVVPPDVSPEPGSPSSIHTSTTLAANSGTPAYYVLSSINLANNEVLRIQGAADGTATDAQIIVTGNVTFTGQSQLIIDPGVSVRIYLEGDAQIGGLGVTNPNTPTHLQIYGVDRPKNPDGTPANPGQIKIGGNGSLSGAIYAPNYDVTFSGGGSSGSVSGAVVAYTISMSGISNFHYDESLADHGLISDYKIVSWFEDEH